MAKGKQNQSALLEPMGPRDIERPLSVGWFLAVFLPTATAVGSALLMLLFKSFSQSESLRVLEVAADDIKENVAKLTTNSEKLLQEEIPDLKKELARLGERVK